MTTKNALLIKGSNASPDLLTKSVIILSAFVAAKSSTAITQQKLNAFFGSQNLANINQSTHSNPQNNGLDARN